MTWYDDAKQDAKTWVEDELMPRILEQIAEGNDASTDLFNDYDGADSYHHENHVDKWYSPSDAIALLEELDEYEETDRGLWEGKGWREAAGIQAAYTYGNAVYQMTVKLIEAINEERESIIEDVLASDVVREMIRTKILEAIS